MSTEPVSPEAARAGAVDAYVRARIVLESVPVCRFERQTYGPPKCRVHEYGTRWDTAEVPWCDKGGREQALRKALEDLVRSLKLEVVPG